MTTDSQLELEALLAKTAQAGITPSMARALARLLPSLRRDAAGEFQALQVDGADLLTSSEVSALRADSGAGSRRPGALLAEACPNLTLTDASSGGIGNTLTQIGFLTIPGGALGPRGRLEFFAGLELGGNDSKTIQVRAGPASGTFSSATQYGGQSGLTTQRWAPQYPLIWNNGSLSAQNATPANTATFMGSTANAMVSMAIDTALDWNIYVGVQSSIANGAPSNTFTLRTMWARLVG